MRFRRVILSAAWLLYAVIAPAQEPAAAAGKDLPNYYEVSPNLGTGGQPTEQGIRQLVAKGYKAIVNLRAEGEDTDLAAEEKLITGLGLKYVALPFVPKDANEELALRFLKAMDELKEQKVFVHCHSGNRVGSLMMVDLTLRQGMDEEKAAEVAARIGLTSDALRKFARQVIETQKKKQKGTDSPEKALSLSVNLLDLRTYELALIR